MNIEHNKGRVTIPTDVDVVPETLELKSRSAYRKASGRRILAGTFDDDREKEQGSAR